MKLRTEIQTSNQIIKFQLHESNYQFLIEAIKKRELNLAFIGPITTDHPFINGHTLFHEKVYLLTHQQHRFAQRKSIYLTELKDEDFVLFPKGYIFEKLVTDTCYSIGFEPNVTTVGKDLDAVKGMVAARS